MKRDHEDWDRAEVSIAEQLSTLTPEQKEEMRRKDEEWLERFRNRGKTKYFLTGGPLPKCVTDGESSETGLETDTEEDLNTITCKAMTDGIMVGRKTMPPSFIKSVTYSEDERGQGSSSQPSTSGTRQIPRIKTPKPKRKCPNPKGEANLLMFRLRSESDSEPTSGDDETENGSIENIPPLPNGRQIETSEGRNNVVEPNRHRRTRDPDVEEVLTSETEQEEDDPFSWENTPESWERINAQVRSDQERRPLGEQNQRSLIRVFASMNLNSSVNDSPEEETSTTSWELPTEETTTNVEEGAEEASNIPVCG